MHSQTTEPLRLLAVLAHPDDESLGFGGICARYAAEGVEVHLLTATRGQRGRHGEGERPSDEEVGRRREAEVRAAAGILGIREVRFLDYLDADLDQADPEEAVGRIVSHLRRIRPDVVVTFGFEGAYGHPDHIAISQLTSAAALVAADSGFIDSESRPAHRIAKLYWAAWDEDELDRYQMAFKKLVSRVDGVERPATPWPGWSLTTRVDTSTYWPTVWKAIQCHQTQLPGYGGLSGLSDADHERLWGLPGFYRVISTVNGGRQIETDLFEGLRGR